MTFRSVCVCSVYIIFLNLILIGKDHKGMKHDTALNGNETIVKHTLRFCIEEKK